MELAFHDIQSAADLLRPVYERTARSDGYVSLEVSPVVARDTDATLAEARRLWRSLDRENVMIKVPGTPEAFPAIRQLLAEGINVNVTLLFSRAAYAGVAEAHLAALEDRAARGEDLEVAGSIAQKSCLVAYRVAGRISAVASIHRDQESLRAEALLERGDQAGLEAPLASART